MNTKVYNSERKHRNRNLALADFMKSYGNIENDAAKTVNIYFWEQEQKELKKNLKISSRRII